MMQRYKIHIWCNVSYNIHTPVSRRSSIHVTPHTQLHIQILICIHTSITITTWHTVLNKHYERNKQHPRIIETTPESSCLSLIRVAIISGGRLFWKCWIRTREGSCQQYIRIDGVLQEDYSICTFYCYRTKQVWSLLCSTTHRCLQSLCGGGYRCLAGISDDNGRQGHTHGYVGRL